MSNIPENLKYTKDHEWVKLDGDIATVGITDFAQHELTDVVFVDLPQRGKRIDKGKTLANVESVKSVSEVFCPITGEVLEINPILIDLPETINKDCYGKGWIAKVKTLSPSEASTLLSPADYKKLIGD
jgi:glycine cleavage system H protein